MALRRLYVLEDLPSCPLRAKSRITSTPGRFMADSSIAVASLEADAVIVLRGGRYALVEVKLGASEVEDGAKSLHAVSDKIDQGVMGAPSFSAVVTPGGYAYRRSDGVLVLPISCLKA